MAYGLTELDLRAQTLATAYGWEYDFGFQDGINDRKTTNPFLSMIIPPRSKIMKAGRQQDETYEFEFLLYKAYSQSSTDRFAKQIAAVRTLLRAFVMAFCDDTNVSLVSDIDFQQLGNNGDINKEVLVSCKFTGQVTNCV